MARKKLTWTDVLLRQRYLTLPQDSQVLTHLLGALDNMCAGSDDEITSDRILKAVQRAFDCATTSEPKPAGYYADATLSARQRYEITEAVARANETES